MGAVCGCIRATAIPSAHNSWPQESTSKRVESQPRETEFAETKNGGIGPVSEERRTHEIRALTGGCEVPATLEVAEASSGDDNNTRVQEARRARVEWLEKLRRECASQEEFDTARSHSVLTQLDSSSCSSSCAPYRPSAAALEHIRKGNRLHFEHLLYTQPSPSLFAKGHVIEKLNESALSSFFADFGDSLKAGPKIGGGAQADIHEAIYNGEVLEWCVLKVFRSEHLLTDLQRSWTKNMIHPDHGWTIFFPKYWKCCGVKHGTLLQDGRFAFVLQRCWGDLRKAIDLEIIKHKTHSSPPFPHSTAVSIIVSIAYGMAVLHDRDIIHKDLKAANCLLRNNPNDTVVHLHNCMVADFQSSEDVEGTRFWRPPEVLLALKNRKKGIYSTLEVWTKSGDVYSYAMTCYEVLTGCIPFEDCAANDYDDVIGGERPPLPDYIDFELQKLVKWCWHKRPSRRPSFTAILSELYMLYPQTRIGFPVDTSMHHGERTLVFSDEDLD